MCSDKGCSFADEQPSRKKRNGQYPADDIEMPVFSTEVVILDRNKKCHVSSGDYEFVLHEQGADFKNASWETVMNGKVNSSVEDTYIGQGLLDRGYVKMWILSHCSAV